MPPAYQVQVQVLQEFLNDVRPEKLTDAPLVVIRPSLECLLGVRPQEIAEKALVGDLDRPLNRGDLL